MTRLPVVIVAFTMLTAVPVSAACMRAEAVETAHGRLVTGRFKDAADRPESAYILQLSAPACLDGSDEMDKVEDARTIHVFSAREDIARQLARLEGRSVRVRGKPFGAHTAHHHAPIVMDVSEIEPR